MQRKLLISDANIIIDSIAGDLVDAVFKLNYDFATPDILFNKEIKQQHPEIIQAGLQILELQAEAVEYAGAQFQAATTDKLSFMDCVALALARQEASILLTGDAKLRKYAKERHIEVKGTIWLVQQLFDHGLLNAAEAETAYNRMRDDGSRLPEKDIQKQLCLFNK